MGSSHYEKDAVDRAVDAGRKSAQLRRALRAAALGLSVALGGVLTLLLLGTYWFPLPLVFLGFVGGAAAAAASWRMSQLSDYEVARILDRAWGSNDQVSTAQYFAGDSKEASDAVRAQRQLAVSAISSHQGEDAIPLRATPVVWVAVALLGAVIVATALRYTVAPSLAIESALTPDLLSGQTESAQQKGADSDLAQRPPSAANEKAAAGGEELAEAREQAEPVAFPLDPLVASNEEDAPASAQADGLDTSENAGDELDFQQTSDQAGENAGEQDNAGDERGSNLDRPDDSTEQAGADGSWSEKSNSLLDRLKEALKQMRENMASEPAQASAQEAAASAEEGSDSSASQQSGEQSGQEASEGEGSAAEASMEPGDPQESAQQASQGSGTNSGEGSEGEGDSAGAAGDGDGSKEIQQQQAQNAAFEALEEFYLQRAEELTGDVMAETNTGEVTVAATPYSPQQAGRREGSGVAVRDEAPAAYRTFVENYFKEIRSKQE